MMKRALFSLVVCDHVAEDSSGPGVLYIVKMVLKPVEGPEDLHICVILKPVESPAV